MSANAWPRRIGGLWGWFRNLMIIAIVLQILFVGFESYEIVNGVQTDEDYQSPATMIWALSGLALGIVWFVVFLLCVVLTCRLTYRLAKNLHTIGTTVEVTSPGWAVGSYFVPLVNLFMPARAVTQIWRGTDQLSKAPMMGSDFIGWWWAFWILSNFASTASFRMTLESGGMDEFGPTNPQLYMGSIYAGVASSILGAAACWFMIKVFKPLAQEQDAIVDAHAVRPVPAPPPSGAR